MPGKKKETTTKEVKKCPKCRGKMIRKLIEVETSETGVLYWRVPGAEPVVYICNKCGYMEFYDKGKTTEK
ncbi:hypothetical protein HXY33_07050 [Candidatus Bathyarchaeota archaeon]|nr:hypothetical protein [Candidatus Bathyarchaeota archaeon]